MNDIKIKKSLLENSFIVRTPSEDIMHKVINLLGRDPHNYYFDDYGEHTCLIYYSNIDKLMYSFDKWCRENVTITIYYYYEILEDGKEARELERMRRAGDLIRKINDYLRNEQRVPKHWIDEIIELRDVIEQEE